MKVFFCKKCLEEYDQTIINFISLTNENEDSEDDYDNGNDLQETHYLYDDMTVDGIVL